MAHLVFIPSPGIGHLYSALETAKLLTERDHRLSVTVLIMTFPAQSHGVSPVRPLSVGLPDNISFVELSHDGLVEDTTDYSARTFSAFVDHHKPQVRDFVAAATIATESTRLAGVVVDMFCTSFIDVAGEFGVPSYVFLTSGAGFLSLLFHGLNQDLTEFRDSDAELEVPGFVNRVPAKVLPSPLIVDDWAELFRSATRRFKQAKGILVNTFSELEPYAIKALAENDEVPPIFPVGPILNLNDSTNNNRNQQSEEIISWLDGQLTSSVLFLCFGSKGCFDANQVVEIARALESSGTRFLWSLRKHPEKGKAEFPTEYDDVAVVLPEGFLQRTAETGKVIGWAPQVSVLSHPAIGGFVSHCGWNSTLESLWCGVPVATWPIHAEQQLNAFQLVKELEMAVKITLHYKKPLGTEAKHLITAEIIQGGIEQLMDVMRDNASSIKLKVKEMSEKARTAARKDGSSYISVGQFIEGVIGNIL